MKLVFTYLKRHIGIFLVSTLFLTLEAVADLLQPTFMSYIVDRGIKETSVEKILGYGGIMLAIALVGAFSACMRNIFASRTSQTIAGELRLDMYRHVQSLSLENVDRLSPASIITRITNDVTQIQNFINGLMRMMVKAPITCVGAIVLIIIQTPKQAPVMIAIVALSSLLIYLNIRFGFPRFSLVQKKLDGLNSITRQFFSSIRVVKAFNAEDEETVKFTKSSTELAEANVRAERTMATFTPLIRLVVNFGVVVLLWVSKSQDASEIGKLMASINYMTQVMFAVNMISMVINNAVRATASAERINEFFSEKPSQEEPSSPVFPQIEGNISFNNVTFSYSGSDEPALYNISFSASAGETIGIIGPTGSGKSTLVNLIPRLYDASEGSVTIDGNDVTKIDTQTLRNNVAVVAQKALLFTGTIAQNLRFGNENATDSDIKKAAHTASADSFIEASENGYDTLLGQGGVNLSGGQKQRLSIARALVKSPKIIILDDCTSALDAQTESTVLSALTENTEKMTVLLISQRISTVLKADRILCLDEGKVMGFGSHKELLKSCATYRAIYESQIGGTI